MRKVVFGTGLLIALAGIFAFAQSSVQIAPNTEKDKVTAINWMSWEEAMEAMEEEPRKVFIDVYTDWCGWCKRMDASTFTDESVIEYMNENYYAVKFNAEKPGDKVYQGKTLGFREKASRRGGVHELAIVLLNGRLGYPSFVYLDEEANSIKVSPGYKTPDVLLNELQSVVAAD